MPCGVCQVLHVMHGSFMQMHKRELLKSSTEHGTMPELIKALCTGNDPFNYFSRYLSIIMVYTGTQGNSLNAEVYKIYHPISLVLSAIRWIIAVLVALVSKLQNRWPL